MLESNDLGTSLKALAGRGEAELAPTSGRYLIYMQLATVVFQMLTTA